MCPTALIEPGIDLGANFAGLRVKDAIADYFRDRSNKRPVFRTQFGFERLPDFDAVLWEEVRRPGIITSPFPKP